mmetsp:Transcript_24095/g.61574  ORF Transcript_24095/g.61574 Transcript_24095/m.61574 type:complete len:205 (+) Transcript_24095:1415-2029(+)
MHCTEACTDRGSRHLPPTNQARSTLQSATRGASQPHNDQAGDGRAYTQACTTARSQRAVQRGLCIRRCYGRRNSNYRGLCSWPWRLACSRAQIWEQCQVTRAGQRPGRHCKRRMVASGSVLHSYHHRATRASAVHADRARPRSAEVGRASPLVCRAAHDHFQRMFSKSEGRESLARINRSLSSRSQRHPRKQRARTRGASVSLV